MSVPPDPTPTQAPSSPAVAAGTTQAPAALVPAARDVPDNDLSGGPASDMPGPAPCPRCGAIDVPTLSPGTGPHTCKTSCAHCGRFIKWVSLLAPSERMAHRVKARLAAMQRHPASAAQLALLLALGDKGPVPVNMAEAWEGIEALKAAKEATRSNAPGRTP